MKLRIHTQHYENYGAHDWDGEGECPQYWKAKGGDTFILDGVTVSQAMDAQFIDGVLDNISSADEYFEVCIAGWDLIDDIDWEEAQSEMDEFDAERVIHLTIVEEGLRAVKHESSEYWPYQSSLLFKGKRVEYILSHGREDQHKVRYLTHDGREVTYKESCEMVKSAREAEHAAFARLVRSGFRVA